MCVSPKRNPEREREKEESLDQLTPPQRQLAKTELKRKEDDRRQQQVAVLTNVNV